MIKSSCWYSNYNQRLFRIAIEAEPSEAPVMMPSNEIFRYDDATFEGGRRQSLSGKFQAMLSESALTDFV